MALSGRQGTNALGVSGDTLDATSYNQNVRARTALGRCLVALFGGEGVYLGGAGELADLPLGKSYPAATLAVLDDSGQAFGYHETTATAITFSDAAGACALYAVVELQDGVASDNATGDVVFVAQLAASTPPAHSLKLGTGTVVASAFTSYTPEAGTRYPALPVGEGYIRWSEADGTLQVSNDGVNWTDLPWVSGGGGSGMTGWTAAGDSGDAVDVADVETLNLLGQGPLEVVGVDPLELDLYLRLHENLPGLEAVADDDEYGDGHDGLKVKRAVEMAAIELIIGDGVSEIADGVVGDLVVPFDCTVVEWVLVADQSGNLVVDVWAAALVDYPPTDGDSITASAPPTLSSADHDSDDALAGWATTLSEGDVVRFNVDSCDTITRATLALLVIRG